MTKTSNLKIWLQTFGVCPFNIRLWQNGMGKKKKKRKSTFQTDYHIPCYHTPKQPLHCALKSLFSEEGVPQADMYQLPVVVHWEFLGKLNFENLSVFLVFPYSCMHTFSFPHYWNSETSAAGSALELCDVDSPSSIQLFCNSSIEENILFF